MIGIRKKKDLEIVSARYTKTAPRMTIERIAFMRNRRISVMIPQYSSEGI
jgi:hypothetical protein